MTNEQLESRLGRLIRTERKITHEILKLIGLADERRMYLERGYSSLFDWLTRHFGYSEPAAQRRIQAARLLRAAPAAAGKIESGALNLTTLAKAQSAIRAQEKSTGTRISPEDKSKIVDQLQMKSSAQAEKILIELLPASGQTSVKETTTAVSADTSRLAVNLPNEVLADLERAKELLSHTFPTGASAAEVLAYVLKDFLSRKDPLRKKVRTEASLARVSRTKMPTQSFFAAAKRCVTNPVTAATRPSNPRTAGSVIPAELRRQVMQRDDGRCSFVDPRTKSRCGSRHQIQLDHIYPKALGGENSLQNLRCLCSAHNRHAAEVTLGIRHANSWRPGRG